MMNRITKASANRTLSCQTYRSAISDYQNRERPGSSYVSNNAAVVAGGFFGWNLTGRYRSRF